MKKLIIAATMIVALFAAKAQVAKSDYVNIPNLSQSFNDTVHKFYTVTNCHLNKLLGAEVVDYSLFKNFKYYFPAPMYSGSLNLSNELEVKFTRGDIAKPNWLCFGVDLFDWGTVNHDYTKGITPFPYKYNTVTKKYDTVKVCDTLFAQSIDLYDNPVVTIIAKSDYKTNIRIDLRDKNGRHSTTYSPRHFLNGGNIYDTLIFRWDNRVNNNYWIDNYTTLDGDVGIAADGWSTEWFGIKSGCNDNAYKGVPGFGRSGQLGSAMIDLHNIVGIKIYIEDNDVSSRFLPSILATSKLITFKSIILGYEKYANPITYDAISKYDAYINNLTITVTGNNKLLANAKILCDGGIYYTNAEGSSSFDATKNKRTPICITSDNFTDTLKDIISVPETPFAVSFNFTPSLLLSANTINLSQAAGSQNTVQIISNTKWRVSSPESWVSLSTISGKGNTSLNINAASENSSFSERSAIVTITSLDGSVSKEFSVVQAPAIPAMSLSQTSLKLPAAICTNSSVTLTANTSWSLTIPASVNWLSISPTNLSVVGTRNTSLTIKTTANTTKLPRTANIIFSASNVADQTLSITQAADSIKIIKQINPFTINLDAASHKFLFADYFQSDSPLQCAVSSSNQSILQAVIIGNGFGLIPYGTGTATIKVMASTETGASALLSFTVTVQSSVQNNCTSFKIASEIITHVSCPNLSDGSIVVSPSGGTKPYFYKWSTTRTDNTIAGMKAGQYSLLVTDSVGCSLFRSYTINQPQEITIIPTATSPSCGALNGSINIAVNGGTPPYTYLWNDGTSINNITDLSAGLYNISITDSKSCKASKTIQLSNTNAPIITLDTIIPTDCGKTNGAINISVTQGTPPYTYKWNDGSISEDRSALAPAQYALTITDASANKCKATIKTEVPTVSLQQPTIALVTVSTKTPQPRNLIVWIRQNTDAIDHYTIYRENNIAGSYNIVGTVPYSDTSVFIDPSADPLKRSWRYKITATDKCLQETPRSSEFKTMYLQKNYGVGGDINLDWDRFEGFDFYSYIIYRQTKSNGIKVLDSVPASINRFTDTQPPLDVVSYFVAIDLPQVINPSLFKSDTGPFSQSLSNMSEASLVNLENTNTDDAQLSIYPKPASSTVSITPANGFAQNSTIRLIATDGRTVLTHVIPNQQASFTLSVEGFAKGLYQVVIEANNTIQKGNVLVD